MNFKNDNSKIKYIKRMFTKKAIELFDVNEN